MTEVTTVKMSLCSAVARYLFFGFNLVFFLSGLALMGGGAYIQFVFYKYDLNAFIQEACFVLPLLVTLTGFTIAFISFFGVCGAAKDSCHRLLYVYGIFVGLLFVMEIATGVLSYVYRQQIHDGLQSGLENLMDDYKDGSAAKALMSTIEDEFRCCGASGPADYDKRGIELPWSCCYYKDGPRSDKCPVENINQLGCADVLKPFLLRFTVVLSSIGILIVLVQLFAIVSATMIARSIRRGPAYQTLLS